MQKCELNLKKSAQNPIEYDFRPRSIAAGDFNKDTRLDIVVANYADNSIDVYRGNGDGTFPSKVRYSMGPESAPYMVAVADFNRDHRLDIAVANFGTNIVGIFLGFGNGSFAGHIPVSTGSSRPVSIAVADLNNDTLLDIVTVNYGTSSVSIFYGYGNGHFSNPETYPTGYDSYPSSLIVGDLNSDNHLDLAIVNYGTNNFGVLFGDGSGNFTEQITFPTGLASHPYSIAAGYFNHAHFLDSK